MKYANQSLRCASLCVLFFVSICRAHQLTAEQASVVAGIKYNARLLTITRKEGGNREGGCCACVCFFFLR